MDKETRNLLFNTTQAIRRLLEEEFSLQLEGTFDVHADGRVAEQPGSQLSASERLVRRRIVEAIQHRLAVGESAAEAVRGFQSEAVFTFLNRLAALKMMEARALVLPCVSQGDQSQGFKEFSGLAPGLIELPDKGYRLYLECLFDEIGREVGVLFDRTDAASQLWPRRKALEAVLAKLNTPELAGVWAEDETIGWIYQYYNDPEERKQMREESSAPRNSRELAVRNQFFTPRYVVEFLTDNTLGRIWYEITKGQTRLRGQCRYLVRRSNEIFLAEGQATPTPPPDAEPSSKGDLIKQQVHIPHRPLKDPREIRMIDPACGSMHFGLYAFDLFTVIYEEAWETAHGADAATRSAKTFAPFVTFAASFADKAAFLREVPRLIVEHNIHGIDIDPRAAQIAGLALWLRAQRAWQALGLKPSDRPPIRRSNVVCAEPMPGEKELLREFVEQQFPQGERSLFQSFLENVWDKMRLAGEAGSLLKIEEEIRSAIEDAREAWRKLSARPMELFSASELTRISSAPELTGMDQAVSSLAAGRNQVGADFWEELEERIYNALRDYAEQAQAGGGFQRRLFAEDAARGFAFIDVCRKRYDVALMNPPFGESASDAKDYIEKRYPKSSADLFAAFVDRAVTDSAANGFVGAISTEAGFFRRTLEPWRKGVLLEHSTMSVMAHFGGHVLDGATVRTASYVLGTPRTANPSLFLRLLGQEGREARLLESVSDIQSGLLRSGIIFQTDQSEFEKLPYAVFGYWCSRQLRNAFVELPKVEDRARVRQGLATGDDSRFLRLRWEIPSENLGVGKRWVLFAKGGEYSPYHDDIHLVVLGDEQFAEMSAFGGAVLRNVEHYDKKGITYPRRTNKRFAPRIMPAGCAFGDKGPAIVDVDGSAWALVALLNSRPLSYLVGLALGASEAEGGAGANSYEVGLVQRLPVPSTALVDSVLQSNGKRAWSCRASADLRDEVTGVFSSPFASLSSVQSLSAAANAISENERHLAEDYIQCLRTVDDRVCELFKFSSADCADIEQQAGDFHVPLVASGEDASFRSSIALDTVQHAIGCAFGRWDIRYATGEQAATELPDPFAALPICPPGQLQNAQGLPARSEDVPASYPIGIPWDGLLVDDENHPRDVVDRVREALHIVWKDRAEAIEQEACEILSVKSLRDWFRKPTGFFAEHLKRYSKSRRQAPIYWSLSSPNGLYTVWLYYHRLTADTLFTVLRDHLKPKLEFEERRAYQLRQEAGTTPSPSQRRDIAEAEELVEDLRAFKAELERVAPLFRPNLNDGVIINYAPLWRMIGLPKWRKDCQAIWNELAKGDYDWAHLALHLWPERVVPKCATDRSLAIAHGLEAVFWQEDPEKPGKWITRKVTDLELRGLIAERTSAAVKAAVEELSISVQHQGSEASSAGRRKAVAGRRGKKASGQEDLL